jgi:hypothetical protein
VASGTTRLRFPGAGAGFAIALDESFYAKHWNGADHCEQIIEALLGRSRNPLIRPGAREFDLEGYRASVLAIIAYTLPIELSGVIDLLRLSDALSAAMSHEKPDDDDDVLVATQNLYGVGELRGVEFTFHSARAV